MARRVDTRSLGFIPLVLMTAIYLITQVFADAIGPMTSDPGFYNMSHDLPLRGCIIPRASL